jgi:DNA-binding NtrC family response regulator
VDVLLLENDPAVRDAIAAVLPAQWARACVSSPKEAEMFLDGHNVKVLVCSDDLPDETGIMFLARTKDRWPKVRRVLLAPSLDGELFFHAMREVSLFDYLSKPVVPEELVAVVARARAQILFWAFFGYALTDQPLSQEKQQAVLDELLRIVAR